MFFTQKKNNLVSFNFSGTVVKIAAARMVSGKLEIINLAKCSIEGLSEFDAVEAIKAAIKDFKLKDPLTIVSVDSQSIITKNIEIPSVNQTEIREIIDLQAGRYTPYAREEILIDYINIDTYHNSYTKVLIVILVQEALKKQLAIVSALGFKPSKVQLASELFGAACAKLSGVADKPATCVALNIDNKSSDFIILYKGKSIFIRNLPMGYDNFLQEKTEFVAHFIEEVKKSLDAYRAEDIEGVPAELLLVGAADLLDAVKAPLVEGMNMPARAVSIEEAISLSEPAKNAMSANRQVSYMNVISSIISHMDAVIDLRPSALKMKLAFEEKSREMIKSGGLVMTLIVLACCLLLFKIYYKGQYLKRLSGELAVTEPQVESLNKASTRVRVVKNYVDYKRHSLEILTELYSIVPDDIYLKGVAIDEKGNVSIKGTAEVMSEVFAFVTALENSKNFQSASAKNTTSRKEEGKDVSEFEITCVLKKK
jgi:hypothetical protein